MYNERLKMRKKLLKGKIYQEAYVFLSEKQTITTQLDKFEHLHNKHRHKKGRK